jgi:dihydroorotate dehydrogenase
VENKFNLSSTILYKILIKPFLFCFDPETAHHIAFKALAVLRRIPFLARVIKSYYLVQSPALKKTLWGIDFPNPVGLAAGFDKNALCVEGFDALGFGFIEIGTLTPKAQPGNDKPRLFRLPTDEAIINRMGFNNDGVEEAVKRLRTRRPGIIVGGNIGKNKVTPNEDSLSDYVQCFTALKDVVDYFVVNVSSPNTPGLRELQEKEPLTHLLKSLNDLNNSSENRKPILLKIAPDLSTEQLDDIVEIVTLTGIDGIIATNTTISREGLSTDAAAVVKMGAGGLSGKPVKNRSTEVIRYIHQKSAGQIPIIGVGGIHSAEDAYEKLKAGASLIQLYSGFIYEGPALVKRINRYLSEHPL